MKNHVEIVRSDSSERIDPAQAADELIIVAEFVKRRLLAANRPLSSDVKEILRLNENDRKQLTTSLRNVKRDGLANAIASLTDSISTENESFDDEN